MPGNYPISAVGQGAPGTPTTAQGGKWGWIIPILGSVVGGIMDKASQDSANKANAQNVDKQIAFQREQNATQYQRGVADMTAAGLNPALAYKQGGDGSGSGAAAENRPVQYGQRLAQAVDAYNNFANGTAQRQVIREQAALTAAQTRETLLRGNAIQPDAALGTNADYIDQYQRSRLAKGRGEQYLSEHTAEQYQANLSRTNQGTATAAQAANLMKTQSTLNEQEFQNEWFRKNISPYINSSAKSMQLLEGVKKTIHRSYY